MNDVGRLERMRAGRVLLPARGFIRWRRGRTDFGEGLEAGRRELVREVAKRPLAVDSVAQEEQILLDGLRRERPREADAAQAGARDVSVVVASRGVPQPGRELLDRG